MYRYQICIFRHIGLHHVTMVFGKHGPGPKNEILQMLKILYLQYLILASVDGAALGAGVPHCTYGTALWVLEVFQANLARHAKPH